MNACTRERGEGPRSQVRRPTLRYKPPVSGPEEGDHPIIRVFPGKGESDELKGRGISARFFFGRAGDLVQYLTPSSCVPPCSPDMESRRARESWEGGGVFIAVEFFAFWVVVMIKIPVFARVLIVSVRDSLAL
jgi:hypothetical protein